MHTEARNFVAEHVADTSFLNVVEFGSRNINGGVKDLISSVSYYGIDLYPGPDVDEVADAVSWRGDEPADLIVCCEVLEHAPDVEGIVWSAAENLLPGGLFIITCATNPRAPHSAHDGGPIYEHEYYRNVEAEDLLPLLTEARFQFNTVEINRRRGDLYVAATKR